MLQVRVKPNARIAELCEMPDGTWSAQIKSPPVDGKANAELVALVASHFDIRKSLVTVKSGASGRMKLIRIDEA
ncbi:MAG: DUF167 domain-containing protein [Betaproteobacteria bacterium]